MNNFNKVVRNTARMKVNNTYIGIQNRKNNVDLPWLQRERFIRLRRGTQYDILLRSTKIVINLAAETVEPADVRCIDLPKTQPSRYCL